MKRWIHAATDREDFVVDSDLQSFLDRKAARKQKSHDAYIARKQKIRRAAEKAFEEGEDTPKNQQEAKDLYNKYKDNKVTASSRWDLGWSKRADENGNAYFVVSTPNASAVVKHNDVGTWYAQVDFRDGNNRTSTAMQDEFNAMDWAQKIIHTSVTASTDTRSRIAQLEEQIEWLKNDISSLNEMLADPNIPRYNDESDEALEDRIIDRQQELAEAEEQLNFAWQDDEAEWNYAVEQQEFNPDGSLALYGSTDIQASDDDRFVIVNAKGEAEDISKEVDPVQIIFYQTWDEMLSARPESQPYIRLNGDGRYELVKSSRWYGDSCTQYVGNEKANSLGDFIAMYPEYSTLDICIPVDMIMRSAAINASTTAKPYNTQIVKGLNWFKGWHEFTITSVASDRKTCTVTEEWVSEDSGKEIKRTYKYVIAQDGNGTEYAYDPKYQVYVDNLDTRDSFVLYADGANNNEIDWDAAHKYLEEKYAEARERRKNGQSKGWSPDRDPEYESYDDEWMPSSNNDYTPSATAGDYSPSNPWDAPGMSISDFI